MGDASTQEVERHVGNPSTGPTLRTEREMLQSELWSVIHQGLCRVHQVKFETFKTFLTPHRRQFISVLQPNVPTKV